VKVPDGYKRCKCRDADGRELGRNCPKLRRGDGSWNPNHGTWAGKADVPAADGTREALRAGGFAAREEMREWFTAAIALLSVPEEGPGGNEARLSILALIRRARKEGSALPRLEDVRLRHATGAEFGSITTGEYLGGWLARHEKLGDWTAATLHSYQGVCRRRLIPLLGKVPIDKLSASHIWDMFDAVDEENARILAAQASGDPAVRKAVAGMRACGITTKRRNLAVLRSALAEAATSAPGRPRMLAVNVADGIKFGRDGGKKKTARSKAELWTAAREAIWRKGFDGRAEGLAGRPRFREWAIASARPSNVMIWRPEHLGKFLDSVVAHRLYALFCIVAYCGLRRGEACGLRWEDVDWDAGAVMIGPTIVQVGWEAVEQDHAKAEASEDWVSLEKIVMDALRAWRRVQAQERLRWGGAWTDTGYVFTHENGQPYHPAQLTKIFYWECFSAGLPPIRLHDLRHGAATLALAAGRSMKEVSAMMRHGSEKITSDIYAAVLPELVQATSAAVVSMVPRKAEGPAAFS